MHSKIFEKLKLSPFYYLINPIFQRFEVLLWIGRGKTPPTPHLIKQALVKQYADKYKLKTFIETGTYLGVMVDAVKKSFDRIYTIEIDKKLYQRAKNKFNKNTNVSVLLGDSGKLLKKVIHKLDTPALFWLDAHYSGGITGKGKGTTPVMKELSYLMNNKISGHIVLIDDAHLFNSNKNYPSKQQVKQFVMAKKFKSLFKVEDNIIIVI